MFEVNESIFIQLTVLLIMDCYFAFYMLFTFQVLNGRCDKQLLVNNQCIPTLAMSQILNALKQGPKSFLIVQLTINSRAKLACSLNTTPTFEIVG